MTSIFRRPFNVGQCDLDKKGATVERELARHHHQICTTTGISGKTTRAKKRNLQSIVCDQRLSHSIMRRKPNILTSNTMWSTKAYKQQAWGIRQNSSNTTCSRKTAQSVSNGYPAEECPSHVSHPSKRKPTNHIASQFQTNNRPCIPSRSRTVLV